MDTQDNFSQSKEDERHSANTEKPLSTCGNQCVDTTVFHWLSGVKIGFHVLTQGFLA